MSAQSKVLSAIALIVLSLVIISQNTTVVTYKLLFWNISMSRIIIFPILISIGFLLGYIVGKKY